MNCISMKVLQKENWVPLCAGHCLVKAKQVRVTCSRWLSGRDGSRAHMPWDTSQALCKLPGLKCKLQFRLEAEVGFCSSAEPDFKLRMNSEEPWWEPSHSAASLTCYASPDFLRLQTNTLYIPVQLCYETCTNILPIPALDVEWVFFS